jgi:hypothetical protein
MFQSLGPPGRVTPGTVDNPASKNRYSIAADEQGYSLTTTFADGGSRRQRVVGRIGAGLFDTSWATAEVDNQSGETSGRVLF